MGWAIGDDGTILKTTNGGSQWVIQTSPVIGFFNDVFFIDANYGWIVGNGGYILRTTNGGTTWENVKPSSFDGHLQGTFFLSKDTGFVIGPGNILKTTDGGVTWIKKQHPLIYGYDITFTDSKNGWAVGSGGTIIRAIDGGEQWYKQTTPTSNYLYEVIFPGDDRNGWAVGNNGTILRTAFGGCFLPRAGFEGTEKFVCSNKGYLFRLDTILQNENASYQWSSSHTAGFYFVNTGGKYFVEITSLCGDTDTASVTLNFLPEPLANAGQDKIICPGDTIQLNASGGVSYSWSATGNPISDNYVPNPKVFPQVTTTFFVNTTDTNGCVGKSSITISTPNDTTGLCIVTIDTLTGKNMLVWERAKGNKSSSYLLYRESNVTNKYNMIGEVMFDSLSVFVDENSDPEKKQYLYKMTVIDSCGNETELSSSHKTLFLQFVSSEGGVNLNWKRYEIDGKPVNFDSYVIYRGSDSAKLTPLDTLSGSLDAYTDKDPSALAKGITIELPG